MIFCDGSGEIDDGAAFLLEHVGQRGLAAQVNAGQIDLLDPLPRLQFGVEDRGVLRRRDPGVVKRDVHRSVGGERRLEQCVDLPLVCNVHVHVGAADLLSDRGPLYVVDVADDHLRALCSEPLHDRKADAGATPGNDGDLAFDASCHDFHFLFDDHPIMGRRLREGRTPTSARRWGPTTRY